MSHVQSSSLIEQKIVELKGGDALFNNDGDVIMTTKSQNSPDASIQNIGNDVDTDGNGTMHVWSSCPRRVWQLKHRGDSISGIHGFAKDAQQC